MREIPRKEERKKRNREFFKKKEKERNGQRGQWNARVEMDQKQQWHKIKTSPRKEDKSIIQKRERVLFLQLGSGKLVSKNTKGVPWGGNSFLD